MTAMALSDVSHEPDRIWETSRRVTDQETLGKSAVVLVHKTSKRSAYGFYYSIKKEMAPYQAGNTTTVWVC